MINNIKREFKFHTMATVLIIISYTIAIVFISTGISYLNEQKEINLDNYSGDVSNSGILSIDINGEFDFNNIMYLFNNTNL